MSSCRKRHGLLPPLVGAALLFDGHAAAAAPSPDQLSNAADAYDKGSVAVLHRDYAAAADWFELANRLAPHPLALQSAISAHEEAGVFHLARAATLALTLETAGADDPMRFGARKV